MTVTVKRTQSGRDGWFQNQQYLYARVTAPDVLLDSTARKYVGVLPANCFPLHTYIRINSSFDKDVIVGTTISNGTTANYAGTVVSSADMPTGTTGNLQIDRFLGNTSTVDVPVYISTATTGASVGDAEIWIQYLIAR